MDSFDSEIRTFGAGDILFPAGGTPDIAYVIVTGRVRIEEANGAETFVAGPGEIVGEVDLFLDQPHRAGVVAIEPVSAVPLTRPQLAAAMRAAPHASTAHVSDIVAGLARRAADSVAEPASRSAIGAKAQAVAVDPDCAATSWVGLTVAAETGELAAQIDSKSLTGRDLPFTVGRKPGRRENAPRQYVDLVLSDRKPYNLSRRHFAFDADRNGPNVRDTGSVLGTIVNDQRIGTGQATGQISLRPGRNIVVAGTDTSPFRFIVTVETD